MIKKILLYIVILLIIICPFENAVYAESTREAIDVFSLNEYDIDDSSQGSLIPTFSLGNNNLTQVGDYPAVYIIKNGQCVAYLPFESTSGDGYKNVDDTTYESDKNFYLNDMDYSVSVFKYSVGDDEEFDYYVDESTVINVYDDGGDLLGNIVYSSSNKVNKNFNDNGINTDYSCFYFDNSGDTLYIQLITKFPAHLDTFTSNFSFDFNTFNSNIIELPDNVFYETAYGILANESEAKYYIEFSYGSEISEPFVSNIYDVNSDFDPVSFEDIDTSSFDRIWCAFQTSQDSPFKYIIDNNTEFTLNGNVYASPISSLDHKLLEYLDNFEALISLDDSYNGYYFDGDDLYIQFCFIADDSSNNNNNSTSNESRHIVINTGVN